MRRFDRPFRFSSLIICRDCDKPMSIGEQIENFCEACKRPFMAEEVTLREVRHGAR